MEWDHCTTVDYISGAINIYIWTKTTAKLWTTYVINVCGTGPLHNCGLYIRRHKYVWTKTTAELWTTYVINVGNGTTSQLWTIYTAP